MEEAGIDEHPAVWIINYLSERPHYVRTNDCVSVLSPFFFTHSSVMCRCSPMILPLPAVYLKGTRQVILDFMVWCEQNNFLLNMNMTKQLVVAEKTAAVTDVDIEGSDIKIVDLFKYLPDYINNK